MSAVFRVRVAPEFQTRFASLVPLVQEHSLVAVSPSDVARLCLERGIAALCAELSPVDSSVKTTKKQDRVPILPRRARHTHAVPDSADPVADPASAPVSQDTAPGISLTKHKALAKHLKDYGHAKEAGTNSNCKVCDRERQHTRKARS